ncbi:hypothetical protein ATO6_06320 [Oceanicola sp. 22II-s10i]|uniref:hypothetical protein n=1 Tax=Oceanicola sp. 22II-s10i TaxID=1317116 RepID=UPI000B521DEC|nr:hypothetical protein [Oceanicola sp. 22II-s10i]OWU86424.1 hypothetical protein ATO6_06320 [Oceanicola sp. 22II-s10i]
MKRVWKFLRDDAGAITVDWVVLTALGVALMGLVNGMLQTGTTGLTDNTATYMTDTMNPNST